MRMPKELRDAWVAALRSGKYPQTKCALKEYNSDGTIKGYCCLGVLQEIRGIQERKSYYGSVLLGQFENNSAVLGPVTCSEFNCEPSGFVSGHNSIADWNDQGVSFSNIADMIERHVEVID